MIPLSQANKLLDIGYSLITVDDKKVPNYTWKASCNHHCICLQTIQDN